MELESNASSGWPPDRLVSWTTIAPWHENGDNIYPTLKFSDRRRGHAPSAMAAHESFYYLSGRRLAMERRNIVAPQDGVFKGDVLKYADATDPAADGH